MLISSLIRTNFEGYQVIEWKRDDQLEMEISSKQIKFSLLLWEGPEKNGNLGKKKKRCMTFHTVNIYVTVLKTNYLLLQYN